MTAYVDGPSGGTPLSAANLNRDFNARPAKWTPNTPYIGGDFCVSPAGDTVSALVSFTSGATYNAADWSPSLAATYARLSAPGATGGARYVALGDSISIAGDTISGATQARLDSFGTYFAAFSGGKVLFVRNAGVGGNKTADMLARFDTDVTPYNPTIVSLQAGTNDFTFGVSNATYRTNIQTLVGKIRTIGAKPILLTMPPVNTAGAAQKLQIVQNNTWLALYGAANNIPVIDMYGVVTDPATGNYLAAMDNGDGTHPSPAARVKIGQLMANQLAPMLSTMPILTRSNVDPSNEITNGLMLTGPSASLGATASTGGTFAAGTYFWKITGTYASSESGGSNEVTATLALNGTQVLNWIGSSLYTGYKVYRGTAAGAENVLVATLGNVTTYTDTGTAGSAASVPATPAITPGWAVNGVPGVGTATNSIVTDAAVPGNMQRIALNAATGYAGLRFWITVGTNVKVGDVLRLSAIVTSTAGIRTEIDIQNNGGTNQLNYIQLTGQLTRSVLTVPDFTVPNTTYVNIDISAHEVAGATTGTADFGQITLTNLTTGALLAL